MTERDIDGMRFSTVMTRDAAAVTLVDLAEFLCEVLRNDPTAAPLLADIGYCVTAVSEGLQASYDADDDKVFCTFYGNHMGVLGLAESEPTPITVLQGPTPVAGAA